jgi:hypothetical protein
MLMAKEILSLNDTIDQTDLTDVYSVFHPAIAQYTFLSEAMELSPNYTIFLVTKQVLANIRKLKQPDAYCLTTMQ